MAAIERTPHLPNTARRRMRALLVLWGVFLLLELGLALAFPEFRSVSSMAGAILAIGGICAARQGLLPTGHPASRALIVATWICLVPALVALLLLLFRVGSR